MYEDNPSFSSSSPSKPGLSLKTCTFPHSRECEGDRTALVPNSPTQAIPQDAVDLESFGNSDIVVGIVGVPQDLALGVICPLTLMPPLSSVPFFADEDDASAISEKSPESSRVLWSTKALKDRSPSPEN